MMLASMVEYVYDKLNYFEAGNLVLFVIHYLCSTKSVKL